jgi:DNA repair protein SbcC/Rad50
MLPITLQVHNFLSYANPPLFDFSSLSTACFSGENGIGKSAIIDAITWALWGEVSRKISGAGNSSIEPHLLRDGCHDMSVELEFDEGQTRYKVIRTFSNNIKSRTTITVFKEINGFYQLITSDPPSITTDKEILQQQLRLDYQTFINTAFIRQGNANEFTSKTPTQRKDVLLPLIVPKEYTKLNEAANLEKRSIEASIADIEKSIVSLQEFLDETVDIEATVTSLRNSITDIEQQLATARHEHETATELLTEQRIIQDRYTHLTQEHDTYIADKDNANTQLSELADSLQPMPDGNVTELRKDCARLAALQQAKRTIDDSRRTIEFSSSAMLLLQKSHTEQVQALHEKINAIEDRKQELCTLLEKKHEIERQAAEYETIVQNIVETQSQNDRIRKENQRRQLHIQECEQELRSYETQVTDISQQIAVLETSLVSNTATEQLEQLRGDYLSLQIKEGVLQRQQAEYHTRSKEIEKAETEYNVCKSQLDRIQCRLADIADGTLTSCPECGSVLSDSYYTDKLTQDEATLCAACKEKQDILSELRSNYDHLFCDDELREVAKTLHQTEANITSLQEALTKSETCQQEIDQLLACSQDIHDKSEQIRAQLQETLALQASQTAILEQNRTVLDTYHVRTQELSKYVSLKERIQQAEADVAQLNSSIDTEKAKLDAIEHNEDYTMSLQKEERSILHEQAIIASHIEEFGEYESIIAEISQKQQASKLLGEIEDVTRKNLNTLTTIENIRTTIEDLTIRIEKTSQVLRNLCYDPDVLTTTERTIAETLAVIHQHEDTLQTKRTERVKAEFTLQQHNDRQEELQTAYVQKERLQREYYLVDIVRDITGRDGIPSALIQTTIEHIEDKTNEIIRLFDPGMSIRFETEKITKTTKQARDTLDIKINTNGEERYYEMYSGGQKYRIDFAIRAAMSSVLSLQAGSPLELLIVDEGFGTQDNEGLDAIVSVINTLQFPKIIVISHVERLRNAFQTNVHFFRQNGSTVFTIT